MSDQDTSLFDGAAATTNSTDLLPEVAELIGEGKKYRTPEDALKSVPHAQKHIQELESTLSELREELTKRATLEEAMAQLRRDSTQIADNGGAAQPAAAAPDLESLAKIVDGLVEKRELSKVKLENQKKVVASLQSAFGEKAREAHAARLAEIGMSQEDFTSLASRSPAAALALFPEASRANAPTSGGTTTGSVNTERFSGSGQVKQGTYAWYSQMRTTDPKKYFSREVQIEMARKAKELGPSFYT